MYESGVLAPAGPVERALEDLLGLERRCTIRRQARVAIPQRPRREVHQCVGKQRRDVDIVGMRAIHLTHRLDVVSVPRNEVGRRVVGLIAAPQRLDERPLDRSGAMRARARRRDLVARLFERCREVDRVERFPLLVVVRPKRIGDPPASQREACVMLDRPLEAPDCLLMVERVGPHKSTVEPRLGARRGCRRPPRVGAEIEIGLHRCRSRSELSHVCTAPGARPVTRRPPRQCRTPVNCRCSTRWHRSRPAQLTASPCRHDWRRTSRTPLRAPPTPRSFRKRHSLGSVVKPAGR